MMRSASFLMALFLLAFVFVACDIEGPPPPGDTPETMPGTPVEPAPETPDPGDAATPAPGVEPELNGTPPPDPAPGVEQEAEPAGPLTFLAIAARDMEFDRSTLRAPARAHVRLEVSNLEGEQHNWALYESEQMQNEIFSTETFSGPGEIRTFEFEAPSEPGEYFFVCEVHPDQMRGVFVVE